jgi:hypothetical protein
VKQNKNCYSRPHSVIEMLRTETTRHHDRFFACAQGVLFVVMMITILAAMPAEAQRAASQGSSCTEQPSIPALYARRGENND